MNVLLVDDEQYFVSALAERLRIRGIDADWASTAEDAIKTAQEKHYDLAILDVKMPNMSGLQLRKKLADITQDMRFIFFTGHGSEEDFDACSEQGESCLVKPLGIEELIGKINEAMSST
jgi:DNA-binding response OmpR family regulator